MRVQKRFKTIGLIARFKPLHNGAALMLEYACRNSEHVKIGIGSSNKYNLRNPFTVQESERMVNEFLAPRYSNYTIYHIPDFAHLPEYSNGKKWVQEIKKQFGPLDAFITGDTYVMNILNPDYNIIHPSEIIPKEEWNQIRGTAVRIEMAKGGEDWKQYVPKEVVKYLTEKKLVERFKKEFGLETLSLLENKLNYSVTEDAITEKNHTREV